MSAILSRTTYAAILSILLLSSCGVRQGDDLSQEDLLFIKSLGLLDSGEVIILFDSNAGGFDDVKTAGGFFTDRRIASYWINEKEKSINSAYFNQVDTIECIYVSDSPTYSSYLKVSKSTGKIFKVHFDVNKENLIVIYNKAITAWKTARSNSKTLNKKS